MRKASLHDITWASIGDSRYMKIPEFHLQQGEVIWIRGASGSGKTTLLNLLGGVICSRIGEEIRKVFPTVAFVMHGSSLLPWLTIEASFRKDSFLRGNLQLHTAHSHTFVSFLKKFKFDDSILKMYPRQLSMGMRQRVELARALACEANLLLLDESFSGIDDITRKIVLQEIKTEVKRSGCAICFTSHNEVDASFLADRCVTVVDGEVCS